MAQPTNLEEYNRMIFENTKIEGFGLGTTQTLPCPFCAAPGFMKYRIVEVEEVMQRPHVCKECGRGAKAIVERDASGVRFEIVQTSGTDAPDWMPKIRRVA